MTAMAGAGAGGPVGRWVRADARLVEELDRLRGRLISLTRFRYRLAREHCEEAVADTLLAWYQELRRHGGLRVDAAYLLTVLHHRALDHKKALHRDKRAAFETVPLAAVEPGSAPGRDRR
jgi:DNA-directed RNA polymerase specialized sigma24 family protein